MRASKCATHRMVDKNGTGRPNFFYNIQRGANDQRGNSIILDNVSDETNGLMAERSIGYEQSQINRGSLQLHCDGRG
jgi:hypothetical protein